MARAMVTRRRAAEVPEKEEEEKTAAEDTTPRKSRASRSSRVAEQAKAGNGSGWGAYGTTKEHAKKSSFNSEDQLKVEDDAVLIKFLEDSPFESYYQHWVQRDKGKKRSWTCPGEDCCPLCELQYPVRCLTLFNVVEIDKGKHDLKFWVCGKNAGDQVEEMALSKRHSPINDDDLYFEVTRKKAEFGYKYTLNPVREIELDVEEIVSDGEIAEFWQGLFESGPTTVDPVNMEGLNECADEIVAKGDK